MVNELRKNLLNALEKNRGDLINETVRAIQSSLDCDMCTLWSINHNNTDFKIGEFVSASLLIRSLKEGVEYPGNEEWDFVHPLKSTLKKYVTFKGFVINETTKDEEKYFFCPIEDKICKRHLSYNALVNTGITYLVCIPIEKYDKKDIHAFLKLAYRNKPSEVIKDIEEIAKVINNAVASAIYSYQIYQKQQILDDLIKNYSRDKSMLKDLFHPIIHRIFRNYFDYEGASVFIWDSFDNKYKLLVSTGITPTDGNASYEMGEGLTGLAASEKKAKIYDDLKGLERAKDSRYKHKYREITAHEGEKMLSVPILRPSNPNVVLGILRFTNKINKYSKSIDKKENCILDYFNDEDVDLIRNASHYLALNIENYLAEEERKDFLSKMSHEFKTPANAIRVTTHRALRKYKLGDTRFLQSDFEHYMQSVIEYSELQIMQVTANLFMSKTNRINRPRYDVDNYPIISIIKDSIDVIKPIARDHGVRFENIIIEDVFPNITLRVDKNAFKMVFYNMLTNAIKYRNPINDFRVSFKAQETPEGLIVNILDDGVGVPDGEEEKIFLLGVRSENVSRINAEGYGIGLHVVRLILDEFDCSIRLSQNRAPTNFEIKIPRDLFI